MRCDVERLVASNNAFGAAWLNPPYDHDASAVGSKRVEFRYLRHAWKWAQDDSLYTVLMADRQNAAQTLMRCIIASTWDADLHILPASPMLEGAERELQSMAGAPRPTADSDFAPGWRRGQCCALPLNAKSGRAAPTGAASRGDAVAPCCSGGVQHLNKPSTEPTAAAGGSQSSRWRCGRSAAEALSSGSRLRDATSSPHSGGV